MSSRHRFYGAGPLPSGVWQAKLDGRFVRLANPLCLMGRLPWGAEISVCWPEPDLGHFELSEDDLVPESLATWLRRFDTRFSAPDGWLARSSHDRAWRVLRRTGSEDRDLLALHRAQWRGYHVDVDPLPLETWTVRPRLVDELFRSAAPHPNAFTYELDRRWVLLDGRWHRAVPGCGVPELTLALLADPVAWRKRVLRPESQWFWSEDWTPAFYAAQARAGCTAIAGWRDDTCLLRPHLQRSYSVLDWRDLHVGKTVARLVRPEALRATGLRLVWNPDPGPVLDKIAALRGALSWLRGPYPGLMRHLAAYPEAGLRVWGIELRRGPEQLLVAGELGFTLGATYTSLSGFTDRGVASSNSLGKAQLVLLARDLHAKGYRFWNLGQASMRYKLELGARDCVRLNFLKRWSRAIAVQPVPLKVTPRATKPTRAPRSGRPAGPPPPAGG